MSDKARHLQRWVCLGCVLIATVALPAVLPQANPQIATAANAPEPKPAGTPFPDSALAPAAQSHVFLPLIMGGVPPPSEILPALIGTTSPGQYFSTQASINQYLIGLDSWAGLSRAAGKGHSMNFDFVDMELTNASGYATGPMEMLWTNGYYDFVHFTTGTRSSASIASGCCDAAITAWAQAYATWIAKGQGRKAYFAPLQEMNGNWTPYGMDPTNFKLAYQRIQNIFAQNGITRSKIGWVYAPNGWSTPPYHLADYYPGDTLVDVVGFSSYNQSCRAPWMDPATVFGPYIQEMRNTVTSNKPLFITQTASSSVGGNKDQWIRDAYSYLVAQHVRAISYFNGDRECDWAIYQPGGRQVQGYKDAVTAPNATRYLTPQTLSGTVLPP